MYDVTGIPESGSGENSLRCRLDFDVSGDARRLGNRFTKFVECFQVSFDCFPNVAFRFFKSTTCSDTAGQIGNIGRPVTLGLFEDHLRSLLSLQSRRLLDRLQRTSGNVVAGMSRIVTTFGFEGCL